MTGMTEDQVALKAIQHVANNLIKERELLNRWQFIKKNEINKKLDTLRHAEYVIMYKMIFG